MTSISQAATLERSGHPIRTVIDTPADSGVMGEFRPPMSRIRPAQLAYYALLPIVTTSVISVPIGDSSAALILETAQGHDASTAFRCALLEVGGWENRAI